jgi:alpha-glucosidase
VPVVASSKPQPWWHESVGYEVYVRSFADSDADGVGDLAGVAGRLDHLRDLGVDLLWITPFYPSPMVDFGYDVSDYCDVDPLFGSLRDFDRLVAEAHARGLRMVIDIVPNHCSDQHRWFREAVADPDSSYRDYFIWRPPAADGGPPNNWRSNFGGPAWTLEPLSGEYYLHLFLPEQPDLNWRNPAVEAEFIEILEFWLARGVDGFRIDVAHALVKDLELRDNVQHRDVALDAPRREQWAAFDHLYDVGQVGTLDIYERWRSVVEGNDAVLIGETYVLEASLLARMLRGDGLHLGFWFKPMFIDWEPEQIRGVLSNALDEVDPNSMISWVSSSHDDPRAATRFGGGDLGRERALAFSTLLFCLPGLPFLYQGEELGLVDGIVTEDEKADPVGAGVSLGRDGCRTPMPWEPGPGFGFSDAVRTWLPHGGRRDEDTARAQRADPRSWFHRFRALIALRKTHPELRGPGVEWVESAEGLVSFRRGEIFVTANAGEHRIPLGVEGDVLFSTTGRTGTTTESSFIEPGEAIVVLEKSP